MARLNENYCGVSKSTDYTIGIIHPCVKVAMTAITVICGEDQLAPHNRCLGEGLKRFYSSLSSLWGLMQFFPVIQTYVMGHIVPSP